MVSLLAGNLFHLSFYPTACSSVSFHPFHLLLSQSCYEGLLSVSVNLLIFHCGLINYIIDYK